MDTAALAAELADDPTGKGYGPLLPDNPGAVADLLNAPTETMLKQRFVTARTILAECGIHGAPILDALEAAATANSAVKWAVRFLGQEGGVDVGHPTTQMMISQLVVAGVLTEDQGDALTTLGVLPASRAEVLGLPRIQIDDVLAAIALPPQEE